ncbi:MAG TPA: zf-HC2 domain-containing protein [Clostridia bacterium]|nr:zf-HC2 domain-containing protein [Clostridia bacterium]
MKKECSIIRDILPLYTENMVSDETREFIEEHLSVCNECKKEMEKMRIIDNMPPSNTVPLKNIRKKLLYKKIQIVLLTTALVLIIAISVFALLTAPKFYPYSDDILKLTENQNQSVTITFREDVKGFSYIESSDIDTDISVVQVEAWTSYFSENILKSSRQSITIPYTDKDKISIYYLQNNDEEDVHIFGHNLLPTGKIVSLPRLALNYYLYVAIGSFVLAVLLLVVFRKKEMIRIWLLRLMAIPVSYVLGHIFIKGFSTTTYTLQRDFFLILLVSVMIYGVIISSIWLYNMKKKR